MRQFFTEATDRLSMTRLMTFILVVMGVLLIAVVVSKDVFYTMPVIENGVVISDGHVPYEVYLVLLGLIGYGIGGKVWSKGKEGKEFNFENQNTEK
ncbi:MAG: hypothetical protein KC483_09165 [Nitrosarchaeum sp.]|nr:hypothetical protein [Nitrosarchaeum sp.]